MLDQQANARLTLNRKAASLNTHTEMDISNRNCTGELDGTGTTRPSPINVRRRNVLNSTFRANPGQPQLVGGRAWRKGQSIELNRVEHPNDRLLIVTFVDGEI